MKKTILTYGSRGDVQPLIPLAHRLKRSRHDVILAAPHCFASLVETSGISFVPLAGDPRLISQRINDTGKNFFRMISSIQKYIFHLAPQVLRFTFQACQKSEMIIHSFLITVGGNSSAREHGVPYVAVQTFPVCIPTREFPNVAMADLPPGI